MALYGHLISSSPEPQQLQLRNLRKEQALIHGHLSTRTCEIDTKRGDYCKHYDIFS